MLTDVWKVHAEFMKSVDPGGRRRISNCSRPERAAQDLSDDLYEWFKKYIYETRL